jgi:sigma-B regulation protein RsbU (phosphoserine phosphatase)
MKGKHKMDDSLLQNISPDHLLTLYQITRTMNSSLDFDQVLNQALDSVMQVTHAERGFLMIADEANDALTVQVARGVSGELDKDDAYSTTIVQQVVETRAPLLTNNAMFDDRYEAGKSIIMRGLRAILCAPMLVKERLVGVVYVDTAIRSGNFTESDRELLSAVAGQAGIAIENARLYTVAVEKGRIERELQMARDMQTALMPHTMPDFPGYEFTATCIPAREMAGDFYDVFLLSGDQLAVVVADVSDKGAAAALFMAVSRSFIRSYARAGFGALETLQQTNDLILDDAESGMFVTAYHSVFDENGRCHNVNAGHNPPLLYRHAEQKVSYLPRGGMAIGWFAENPMQQVDLSLQPGDMIIYYTDGLTEAENPAGDFYGESRLEAVIMQVATAPVQTVLDAIIQDVEAFTEGLSLADDLTLFIMRYTG